MATIPIQNYCNMARQRVLANLRQKMPFVKAVQRSKQQGCSVHSAGFSRKFIYSIEKTRACCSILNRHGRACLECVLFEGELTNDRIVRPCPALEQGRRLLCLLSASVNARARSQLPLG